MSYFKQQLIASLEGVDTNVSLEESMEAAYQVSHILNEIKNETTSMERCESILKELTMQNVAIESIVNANGKLTENEAGAFEAARRSAAIALGLSVDSFGGKRLIDNVGLESMVINKDRVSLEASKEIIAKIKETLKKIWEWMVKKYKELVLFLRKSIKYYQSSFNSAYEAIYKLSDEEYNAAVENLRDDLEDGQLNHRGKLVEIQPIVTKIKNFLTQLNKANNNAVNTLLKTLGDNGDYVEGEDVEYGKFADLEEEVKAQYRDIEATTIEFGLYTSHFNFGAFIMDRVANHKDKNDPMPYGKIKGLHSYPDFNKAHKKFDMNRKELLKVLDVRRTIDKDINYIIDAYEDYFDNIKTLDSKFTRALDPNNEAVARHAKYMMNKYLDFYKQIMSWSGYEVSNLIRGFMIYIRAIKKTAHLIGEEANKLKSGEE